MRNAPHLPDNLDVGYRVLIEENWAALFRTCDLIRAVASAVATDLGYEYPWNLDRRMVRYLSSIKDLEK